MTVAKVVELSSDSTKSFEDAVEQGIKRAEKTLKHVKGAWIAEQTCRSAGSQSLEPRAIDNCDFAVVQFDQAMCLETGECAG